MLAVIFGFVLCIKESLLLFFHSFYFFLCRWIGICTTHCRYESGKFKIFFV